MSPVLGRSPGDKIAASRGPASNARGAGTVTAQPCVSAGVPWATEHTSPRTPSAQRSPRLCFQRLEGTRSHRVRPGGSSCFLVPALMAPVANTCVTPDAATQTCAARGFVPAEAHGAAGAAGVPLAAVRPHCGRDPSLGTVALWSSENGGVPQRLCPARAEPTRGPDSCAGLRAPNSGPAPAPFPPRPVGSQV